MNGYLVSPLEFLLSTLVGLYITAILLRFLLHAVRADAYNPISQFLRKVTDPALSPLRRLIPNWRGKDMAALTLALLLQCVLLFVVAWLRGRGISIGMLLPWALAELLSITFNIFIFAIIIQAVMSWISPGVYNPVTSLVHSLNAPVLRPVSRLIPPISGVDLSPLFAILGLQVAKMLLVPVLHQLAAMAQ